MADRTAADIFGRIFEACANEGDAYSDSVAYRIAKTLWDVRDKYDFSDDQMDCDKALIDLGLAKKDETGTKYVQKDGSWNY